MALRVHKSELNSSKLISLLDSDIQDTDKLITELSSFVTNTKTTLTGPAYDTARKEVETYIKILNQRKITANEIKTAISNSTSSLSSYMGQYDYLDDSDLSILNSEIQSIKSSYNSIKNSYRQKYQKNIFTRIYLNWALSNLDKQCANQIAPIQDEINKIKGLASADATAYGYLAKTSTSSYRTAITNK